MQQSWAGEHVVVCGGAGLIGSWIVRDLLVAGATVVVPSRRPSKLLALEMFVGDDRERLVSIATDISTEAGALHLTQRLRADHITPVAAVASLGGWWEGEHLLDLPVDAWNAFLASHLTTHFLAARSIVPLLGGRDDPCYVTLNGIGTHQPCIGSGPICVTGAGQTMLLRMLDAENDRPGLRFHELSVLAPINTDTERSAEDEEIEAPGVAAYVRTILTSGFDATQMFVRYPEGQTVRADAGW